MNYCEVAIVMQDWLSSQPLQKNCGAVINKGNTLFNREEALEEGQWWLGTDGLSDQEIQETWEETQEIQEGR